MIRERMNNPAEMDAYARLVPLARADHHVERLASYGALDVLEGAHADGLVINRFATAEEARRWYDSPACRAARVHRQFGAECRVFIVEGVDVKPVG